MNNNFESPSNKNQPIKNKNHLKLSQIVDYLTDPNLFILKYFIFIIIGTFIIQCPGLISLLVFVGIFLILFNNHLTIYNYI